MSDVSAFRSGAVLAAAAMTCVGSSVAVSATIVDAPLFTLQAVRYTLAALLLALLGRATGRRLPRPRGWEWAWLCGVAVTGLVLFNVAVVRGVAHAEPAVIGVAVAAVPLVLAVCGPLAAGSRPAPAVVVGAGVVTAGAALVSGGGRTDLAGLGWAVLVLACEAAFTLLAVPVLRRTRPDLERPFKVMLSPWVPILAALICVYLMLNLSLETWIRFLVWLVLGMAIYFLYGYRHSRLRAPGADGVGTPDRARDTTPEMPPEEQR